ncbi:MAG TPA: hypothetical protein VGV69_01140 [Solirubrobacterales bacterium]|nr:hypothetical protein [Solirubrobacterales bacterium]
MAAKSVTIHREAFLNGDAQLKDEAGNLLEVDWDVGWATEDGKSLHWSGMSRGTQVFHHGKLVFVAGQKEAPDGQK